jgi:serine/threonine-protein kinase
MLAVVLGVLVLVCAGVISYLVSLRNASANGMPPGMITVTLQIPADGDGLTTAPYGGVTTAMSEGRQTR